MNTLDVRCLADFAYHFVDFRKRATLTGCCDTFTPLGKILTLMLFIFFLHTSVLQIPLHDFFVAVAEHSLVVEDVTDNLASSKLIVKEVCNAVFHISGYPSITGKAICYLWSPVLNDVLLIPELHRDNIS